MKKYWTCETEPLFVIDWHEVPTGYEGPIFTSDKHAVFYITKFVMSEMEGSCAYDLHRFDGPAIEWSDGSTQYYIDDIRVFELDYWNHPKVAAYKLKKLMEL